MSQITQENRLIAITDFSLGKDTFLLTSFEGWEYISDLFEFHIEAISENLAVSPEDVVGKQGCVTIQNDQGRVFNGFIRSFSFGEVQSDSLRTYRMVMVPWLWFLTQTNGHRIFQEKTTQDIVSQIFDDLGFNDYEFRTAGGFVREYCVQHNESDFNFVSRLLEEDGIAYFFEHSDNKHKLILVDQQNAYPEVPETDLEYSKGSAPHAQIFEWEHDYRFKKGVWTTTDFNFKEPSKNLLASTRTKSSFANNSQFEHYEYPGLYDTARGNDLVKMRLEAEEVGCNAVNAKSNCSSFHAGGKFKLAKHEAASEKGDFIILAVRHEAKDTSHSTSESGSASYNNQFVCMPDGVHFRPARLHQKPVMPGPQSAFVVGPDGEEVYIDEFGRVKVQFHWDREGENNENSSCFLRVMQSWAGNQWGASFIPRIGHEVIVSFLDGDPDRPLVTGSVYNGKNKPVYSSKTQSGIKTRSTKGGDAQNFNEIRFDDKKDAEQVYLHAEKDFDTQVENNQTLTVDNDRTKTVKNNESSSIGKDRSKTVGNNQTASIAKNDTIDVGENYSQTIGKNMAVTVGKSVTVDVGENHTESVAKDMSVTVGKDLTEAVKGNYVESVSKDYGLKAKSITLQADDQITFKTGSASIVMKKNGDITISGKNINVKGSGNVVIKGSKVSTN